MIDAHHHIWLQKDLPWLLGPEQKRAFGSYAAIKRDYEIDEYLRDIEATGVTKSVYVQSGWAPNWFEDEVNWVQSIADETGWPNGIIGYADFTVDDVRPQLERLKKYPLMRGLRQPFHWHDTLAYRGANRPDLPADPIVQRNVAQLANYGWCFELQVFPHQADQAVSLARACPEVTFVLQHTGMLEDNSEEGRAAWMYAMRRISKCKNVVVKLSGFGTFSHRYDPEAIAHQASVAVKLFGAKRSMFGSNFPIEKLWTTYPSLVGAFKEGTSALSAGQQSAVLRSTAARVYRL